MYSPTAICRVADGGEYTHPTGKRLIAHSNFKPGHGRMTLRAMNGDAWETSLRKRGGYFFLRGVRVVAVIAQVSENHVAQSVMGDTLHQIGSLFVG